MEFAAQLHKRLVFIHPFQDGNGRVARLLMNLALTQDGYLPVVVPPILRGDYASGVFVPENQAEKMAARLSGRRKI